MVVQHGQRHNEQGGNSAVICIGIIGTGGMASLIAPYSDSLHTIDPHLTLKGLRIIYNMNINAFHIQICIIHQNN